MNFYYYHKFPMKHLLHFNKLWIICHFMSIQTKNVACVWKCLLWFLTLLWCLCVCHYGLFLLILPISTLWLVIPQLVQYLSIFLLLLCVFSGVAYLILCGTFLISIVFIPSHNIVASLCYYSIDHFIPIIAIIRYDCKLALNTIFKKIFVVIICKPWTNFWIHS